MFKKPKIGTQDTGTIRSLSAAELAAVSGGYWVPNTPGHGPLGREHWVNPPSTSLMPQYVAGGTPRYPTPTGLHYQ